MKSKTESDTNGVQQGVHEALNHVREQFRRHCHKELDVYLNDVDLETELPTIDMIIAYAGQGWGVSVGVSLREPDDDTPTEIVKT